MDFQSHNVPHLTLHVLFSFMKRIVKWPQKQQRLGDNDLLRKYHRVFRTREGYLGLGQRQVEVGDWIVLVVGAKVPLVLRKKAGLEGNWEVNGDCYVYGIMHGEMFQVGKCQRMEIAWPGEAVPVWDQIQSHTFASYGSWFAILIESRERCAKMVSWPADVINFFYQFQ